MTQEKLIRFSVDLPASLKNEFHKLAIDRGFTQRELIIALILEELDRQKETDNDKR